MDIVRLGGREFAVLLVLVPAAGAFYWYAFRRKQAILARFGSLPLMQALTRSTSRRRQISKALLVVSALTCMVLSLMRPQIGTRLEEVKREGQDIIIALDVSQSMLAEDIAPNRLEKAKHEVATFITRLQGDRIGLVAFAGDAFVQCPLTLDYGAARMFLDILDTGLIPKPGTAIGKAILAATAAFNQQERKHKILILITDGEDHESDPVDAAREAAKQGVVIYTVGLGKAEGQPIPALDPAGARAGFKKDRQGQVVISKLDELSLEKIALETNGKYYRATPGEAELDLIYETIAGEEKKELASLQFTQYEDRFQYFLALTLVLLIMEAVLPERHRLRGEWRGRFAEMEK